MNDERRLFRGKERLSIYLLAGGRCERCKVELGDRWEADHIRPHSRGGSTNVANGQALCPDCNQRKGDGMNRAPRDWQRKAYEGWGRKKTFMLAACPGSGKTQFALMCAEDLFQDGLTSLTIFVVPRTSLVQQVCSAAHDVLGAKYVPLDNADPRPPRDAEGIVVTYQQVAELPSIYAKLSDGQFVVFDEAHHMADEGHWGNRARMAFDGSEYKLLTTGTPWRTDGQAIPFVEFDEAQELKRDYDYLFSDAWADPNCPIRSIEVERIDADGIWSFKDTDSVVSVRGSLLDPASKEEGSWLGACYKPGGDWVRLAFESANEALKVAQKTDPKAQGLWIAQGTKTADAYSEYLTGLGISHSVVHGEVARPHAALAAFPESNNDWCIAVDMVSEGVDNSRFAVLLFASRKTTEMYFQQACGRVIRKSSANDSLTAKVFVPDSPTFRQHIELLDKERAYALREREKRERSIDDALDRMPSQLRIHGSENAEGSGSTLKGQADLDDRKRELIERIQRSEDPNEIAAAEQLFPDKLEASTSAQADLMSPSERSQLRDKRQAIVGQISKRHGVPHNDVNSHMGKLFGAKNQPTSVSPFESVKQRSDGDLVLEVKLLVHWRDTGRRPFSLRLERA